MDWAYSGCSSVEDLPSISTRSGNQIEHRISVGHMSTHGGLPLMASCRFFNRDSFLADSVRSLHCVVQRFCHKLCMIHLSSFSRLE